LPYCHSILSSTLRSYHLLLVYLLFASISMASFGQGIVTGDISGKVTGKNRPGLNVPAYNATLSSDVKQPITGWGCFPGFIDWGASIRTDKKLQDAIYRDLGMTVGRVKIYPNYCNPDGSLNTSAIDTNLALQIRTMLDYGIKEWIVTTWSPPVFMKTFETEKGNMNGEPNRLKPEFEDAFVKFYARVIAYLRDVKNLGTPVYATIQNEPYSPATWDGCKYDSDQWQRVTKKLRVALNNENLNSVKIHGPDHNHFMVTYYLSALWSDPELLEAIDGIAFHSYCEKNEACGGEIESGGTTAVDARDLILRFKNELKKGNEIWQTENCTVMPEDLTVSAIRHLRKMMRDIGYLEANCYIYWLGASDRKNFAGEELIFNGTKGTTTKLYYVFRKLWNIVTPGSFFVRTFSFDDDPALSSFGPDPMDMLGFSSENKTVVLLTNPTDEARNITIKGLAGSKMSAFRTSATEDMADAGSQVIIGGTSTVYLPEHSVILMETNGGK